MGAERSPSLKQAAVVLVALAIPASACTAILGVGDVDFKDAGADVVAKDAARDTVADRDAQAHADIDVEAESDVAPSKCTGLGDPETDASLVTFARGVFVAATGSDTGSGTATSPLLSITAAIGQAAAQHKCFVFVCEGSLTESVVFKANGIGLFGGFDCQSGWAGGGKPTQVTATSDQGALEMTGVSGATIENFDFEGIDPTAPGGSSIAAWVASSTSVVFKDVQMTAQSGSKGSTGTTGDNYTAPEAANGNNAERECPCYGGDLQVQRWHDVHGWGRRSRGGPGRVGSAHARRRLRRSRFLWGRRCKRILRNRERSGCDVPGDALEQRLEHHPGQPRIGFIARPGRRRGWWKYRQSRGRWRVRRMRGRGRNGGPERRIEHRPPRHDVDSHAGELHADGSDRRKRREWWPGTGRTSGR
jgi:hypothetical protein